MDNREIIRTTYETGAKSVTESLRKACEMYYDGEKDAAFEYLAEFNSAPLSHEVMMSISEFLGETRNKPVYNVETEQWDYHVPLSESPCDRNLLSRCLDIFRGRSAKKEYGIYNIISIMKKGRDNDLSGENLSDLDLRNCSLNGIQFSRAGCHTTFHNAVLDHSTFEPHGPVGGVFDIAFSPDGRFIAVVDETNTVKVYDTVKHDNTFATFQALDEDSINWVKSARFNHKGNLLLTTSTDGAVNVWSSEDYKLIATIAEPDDYIIDAEFSPDDRMLVTVYTNGDMKILETETFCCISTYTDPLGKIRRAGFLSDGHTVITVSENGELHSELIKLRNVSQEKCVCVLHKTTVSSLYSIADCVSFGGHRLAYLKNGSIIVIKIDDGTETELRYEGYECYDAIFSPDGRYIFSSVSNETDDEAFVLWDMQDNQNHRLCATHSQVVKMTFSPDGKQLVIADSSSNLHFWNTENLSEMDITLIDTIGCGNADLRFASFHPAESRIVTVGNNHDNTAKVWDIETGNLVAVLGGHTDCVSHAMYTRDGRYIITASLGTVKVWNSETFASCAVFGGFSDEITNLTCNGDSDRIAVLTRADIVHLCSLTQKCCNCTVAIEDELENESHITHSQLGKEVAVYASNALIIYDSETGERLRTWKSEDEQFIEYVSFFDDDRKILVVFIGGEVAILDAQTLKEESSFGIPDESDMYHYVSVCGSSKLLVNDFDEIAMWDIKTGKRLYSINIPKDVVCYSVSLAPDETTIAAIMDGDSVVIQNVRNGEIINKILDCPGMFIYGCDMSEISPESTGLTLKDIDLLGRLGGVHFDRMQLIRKWENESSGSAK